MMEERQLRVHSILYGNEPARIRQAIEHLERAADHAIARGAYASVRATYGDCSPKAVFDEEALEALRAPLVALERFDYRFFDKNLGSAKGHNTLLADAGDHDVLIINPDIMLAPDAIVALAGAMDDPKVGIAEAKQLPVEHPKAYDPATGDTAWAATACTLVRGSALAEVGGFDHESFFLYCDDVDFSWRMRLSGYRVVYVPAASAFHDKRLGPGARWEAGQAERFYSAQASLFLAHKYSRPDLVRRWLQEFEDTGDENFLRAAESFREREEAGSLPDPIDADHDVASFVDGHYSKHRFAL
jgi:GT2 family glycosyltransferase